MSLDALVELIHSPPREAALWEKSNQEALSGLFGGGGGRYPRNAADSVRLRAPWNEVPFAAYIHPSNMGAGRYGGLSFVLFPAAADNMPCLISLCVGTDGLAPDEAILGRPGHARKVQAIAAWLNAKYGDGEQVAWAKHDPTQTDVPAPIATAWSEGYKPTFDRYGSVLYGLFRPTASRVGTREAVAAFLDLLFAERGYLPLASARADSGEIQRQWVERLMPATTPEEVATLLRDRHFVVLEGPPGTGKTRMASRDLLHGAYQGHGALVQFHPNLSYETFIGGLAPVKDGGGLGLQFAATPGILMSAARRAAEDRTKSFLLVVDEINRADLAKILGEALYLFEWPRDGEAERAVEMPLDFGPPFGRSFSLPENLHVLGTMNTADRSIAIVDVAVRRRFAFAKLWPQSAVLARENAAELMREAFQRLALVFIEHAGDDAFNLVPGHSYFLERDAARGIRRLRTSLAPLLEEYLAQGYVTGFAEPIRAYLQWLASL